MPEGLVVSCPVTMSPPGYWKAVEDFTLSEDSKARLLETIEVCATNKICAHCISATIHLLPSVETLTD